MLQREDLLEQYGSTKTSHLVKDCLYKFAYIPTTTIDILKEQSLDEDWGNNLYVLRKYIAITLYWSIEQARYIECQDGFIVTAGLLRNRYSVPLYLKFEKNNNKHRSQPWALTFAGSGDNFEVLEYPAPPEVPQAPQIPIGNEIVVKDEHIIRNRSNRIPFLQSVGTVAQICALNGAIQWSIYRGLQQPCWYYGKIQYYVPIYLHNQENITATPDLVVPLEIRQGTLPLFVRTALNPLEEITYYGNIRPIVARSDQLQPWIVSSWRDATKIVSDDDEE